MTLIFFIVMDKIAENILALRRARGLKQSDISDQLGFKQNTWSNWETGISKPDLDTLRKIADYFNDGMSDIIELDLTKTVPVGRGKKAAKASGKQIVSLSHVEGPAERRSPSIISVAKDGEENIVYVPVKAQAGYLVGYGDAAYIEQLPSFSM